MEHIFVYLTNLSSNFAYLIIFTILIACGLGFPLPEDIPLVACGYLIWEETLHFAPGVLCALCGVLIGDTALFYIGRHLGVRILYRDKFEMLFPPKRIRRVRAYFRKFGVKLVFFARFVAGFRAIAFFLAGAMKMKYSKFILLDFLAALISVPLWIFLGYGLGYYLGDQISQILKSLKHLKTALTLIIMVVSLFFIYRSLRQYQKAKKIDATAPSEKNIVRESDELLEEAEK